MNAQRKTIRFISFLFASANAENAMTLTEAYMKFVFKSCATSAALDSF